jgi:hypothetical protein
MLAHESELFWCWFAVDPICEVDPGYTVAYAETRHLSANGNHVAGSIGPGDGWILARDGIVAALNHQIAIIQRHGAHSDQHFARRRRGDVELETLECFFIPAGKDSICVHDCLQLKPIRISGGGSD